MALRELAILVNARGTAQASKAIGGVSKSLSGVGDAARRGASAAATNLTRLGVVAGVGLTAAIKTGLDDLATLEDATTKVDGAIRQLGLTGKLTSGQVSAWSNEIAASVQEAFDDKDITAATASLIRYGGVGPKNIRKAMVVMTDLAAKTGDVGSASALLGKALAAPEKAAGKLAKVGIVLTKSQQDQIKSLVAAGKAEQAQAILLDLLATKTKGAAAASAGPYRDAMNQLGNAAEDARKALAIGFLPVIQRVADFLSKRLADPKVIGEIQGLGTGLAGAFDKVLTAAEKIPWSTIGDSMKLAGQGAKAALDLFTGLPPWVQTAVITGWGLNKLTGGALGSIVGELGKGLIKGVLGMNAGVVNINAAAVNGAGGVPATGAGAAAAKGGMGLASKVFLIGEAIGLAMLVNEVRNGIADQSTAQAEGIKQQADVWLQQSPSLNDLRTGLGAVEVGIAQLRSNPLLTLVQGEALTKLEQIRANTIMEIQRVTDNTVRTVAASERAESRMTAAQLATAAATRDVRSRVEANRIEVAGAANRAAINSASLRDRIEANRIATAAGAAKTASAAAAAGAVAKAGGLAAAAAVRAKDLSVRVTVPVTTQVSVRSVIGAATIYGQYSRTSSTQRTQF